MIAIILLALMINTYAVMWIGYDLLKIRKVLEQAMSSEKGSEK